MTIEEFMEKYGTKKRYTQNQRDKLFNDSEYKSNKNNCYNCKFKEICLLHFCYGSNIEFCKIKEEKMMIQELIEKALRD